MHLNSTLTAHNIQDSFHSSSYTVVLYFTLQGHANKRPRTDKEGEKNDESGEVKT